MHDASESCADHLETLRVLVVDDTPDSAWCLAALFESEGHVVRVAHNAHDAIELAMQFRPAAIFMDVGLPNIDGFEATRMIRRLHGGRDILICALTGFDGVEHLRRAREVGVDHYLLKPFDPDKIVELLIGAGRHKQTV